MAVPYLRQLNQAARKLRSYFGPPPEVAVVFGSGLGGSFLRKSQILRRIRYSKIPYFPSGRVPGHGEEALLVLAGMKKYSRIFVLNGRVHYYEGFSPERVVFPLRSIFLWGVRRVILTNASGAINPRLRSGTLVMIRDHINLTGANPLHGPNLGSLGPRFPSLQDVYQNSFSKQIQKTGKRLRLPLASAVYVGVAGPSYETLAEIKAYRVLGGDLVGMSTVFEAIAAAHMGMQIAALAAVTNSYFDHGAPLNHQEVLKNARRVDEKLGKLLLTAL